MFDVHYVVVETQTDDIVFSSEDEDVVKQYIDERVAELRNSGYILWNRGYKQDVLRNEECDSIIIYTIKERVSDNNPEK